MQKPSISPDKLSSPRSDRDYVTALARGLEVIRAFGPDRTEMTLAEVAVATGQSAATSRRYLHTLLQLGYVAAYGRKFMLRSKVLELGSSFWGAHGLERVAQDHLLSIVDKVDDSASLAVLEGPDVLYIAHVARHRTVRMAAGVGSRFPAYATALGRTLLASGGDEAIAHYLATTPLVALTERTQTDPKRLRTILERVRKDGYAAIEDELDYGIASVATPIIVQGRVVAAVNSSSNSARRSLKALVEERLELLRATAAAIGRELERSPALVHALSLNGGST